MKPSIFANILPFSVPFRVESLRFNPYQTLTSFGPTAPTGAACGQLTRHNSPEKPSTPKCSKSRPSFPSPQPHGVYKRVLKNSTQIKVIHRKHENSGARASLGGNLNTLSPLIECNLSKPPNSGFLIDIPGAAGSTCPRKGKSWVISPKKAPKRCPDYKQSAKDDQKSSTIEAFSGVGLSEAPCFGGEFTGQAPGIALKYLKNLKKRPSRHRFYSRGSNPVVVTMGRPAFSRLLQPFEIIESSLTRSPGRYRR